MDGQIDQEELEEIVAGMTNEQQAHFKMLISTLVQCYAKGGPSAVVIRGYAEDPVAEVLTVNAASMEAMQLMLSANDFFNYLSLRDAPPREEFN
jgi:hypothetical protein